MGATELIVLNFEEIRRRSINLWQGLPEEFYYWKPDQEAMTAIDIIRHVLSADYGWHMIINNTMNPSTFKSPWEGRNYTSLTDELAFTEPYRQEFLAGVRKFSPTDPTDLSTIEIIHPGNGTKRKLGDYLLRIGYHESVHAGQFLAYLRTMRVNRPFVWD